jgi:hypothetical protein
MGRLGALLLVAATLLGGWLVAGPFIAMHGIQQGAEARDGKRLKRNVDFPVLRENLRPQVQEALDRKLSKKAGENPLAALGLAYSDRIADKLVDEIVTPQGIETLLNGEDWRKKRKRDRQRIRGEKPRAEKAPVTREWGFNSASEFELAVTKGDKQTRFILTRRGLDWNLTNIHLPRKITEAR